MTCIILIAFMKALFRCINTILISISLSLVGFVYVFATRSYRMLPAVVFFVHIGTPGELAGSITPVSQLCPCWRDAKLNQTLNIYSLINLSCAYIMVLIWMEFYSLIWRKQCLRYTYIEHVLKKVHYWNHLFSIFILSIFNFSDIVSTASLNTLHDYIILKQTKKGQTLIYI